MATATKLSLKVLVDSRRNKVLFAEADSDFVDVLFSFMTLPLGNILSLFDKHHLSPQKDEAMGSLKTLRGSLEKLSSDYFWTEGAKLMLLHPRNSSENRCRKLKLNIDSEQKYYVCKNIDCLHNPASVLVSPYNNITTCLSCGNPLNEEISFGENPSDTSSAHQASLTPPSAEEGVFVRYKNVSFLVTDDLQVKTNFMGSSLEVLNSLGFKDMSSLEQKTIILGLNEMVRLLKECIISKTPLSDLVFHNNNNHNPNTSSSLSAREGNNTRLRMEIKAVLQKSTNKIVFAEAEQDFVDFIFSSLVLPLGSVASSLLSCENADNNNNHNHKNIPGCLYNLYESIRSLKTRGYMSDWVMETLLMPRLPPYYYHCKNIFVPVFSRIQITKNLRSYLDSSKKRVTYLYLGDGYRSTSKDDFSCRVRLVDPRSRKDEFVRGPRKFMVTDNLEVTPLTAFSGISYLDKLGIPFSDVQEVDLNIGAGEAREILRASITSSSVLTNVFFTQISSKKLPIKQEK